MSSASVTDVTETSVVAAATSTSVVTTTSTSTSDSVTSTLTSDSTTSSIVSVSSVFVTPSTTFVPASTTQPSVVAVTSTVTQSPASTGGTSPPSVVIITSTAPPASTAAISTPTTSSSSSSSSASALSASGSGSSSSGGLSNGGTIAIAVVIPIVAIAALFLLGLFFWRRRKQRKVAEEQRKAEIEDYGLNPNQDPTLATAAYAETGSEMAEDNGGYRGWGNTSSAQRKPSTTLGSGSRGAAGVAAGTGMSETSSTQGGNAYTHAPGDEAAHNGEGIATGALAGGAIGAAAGNRRRSNDRGNIHRGPSNASSAYSAGPAHTDASEELPGNAPAPYYHEEGPYNYIDAQAQQGPYGDGTYHPSGQPVIRNVQARRNTKIERVPTLPNVGIAQNF